MALTLENVRDKIIQAKPQLLKILVLDVRLRERLHKMEVITDSLKDQTEDYPDLVQIDLLLDDIMTGPVWRFLHFCKVMHEEGKPHVLEALDVDIADIEHQLDIKSKSVAKGRKHHYYKSNESGAMIQISNDLLPGLLQHCGSYNRSLMKASLFGYKKNVPIDLKRIYIHHDAVCQQNLREKRPVGKKELFLRLFGTRCPNCLSMEGPAGTGKSSYLEEYAHDWSQEVTSCEENGPDVPCEGHPWMLVVYIAAAGIRGTAADAIRDNLRCKPHQQGQMMTAIEEDGDGVLIMYDAIDELRRKDSIDSISSYVETSQNTPGTPNVLVTARDGLLSVERSYFDRQLHLEGFSLQQGIDYMKQYFREMHSISDHPVLQYVEAHAQDLEWVLSNPLRVHILSELTACGDLTCEDLKTLTTIKLFRSLDVLLLKRDKECRPTSSPEMSNFYQACLRCLLTDQRMLSEEDVSKDSPYLSLLQRHTYRDQDFHDCFNFSFPHETLFEYFSMRGLIECLMNDVEYKQGMLLWLCSKPKMRNLLQLTCGYIAQYEPQLLPDGVFIIRACLILQTEYINCEQNELTEGLLPLPAIIQETFPPDVLTDGLTGQQAATLGAISNQVQAMFNEKADNLREAGWFLNEYDRFHPELATGFITNSYLGPFHRFLLGCLQQLTPQQLEDVFRQTFTQLLPCTRYISQLGIPCDVTAVPVGGVRWASVQQRSDSRLYVDIYLWSACDLSSVLNTWSHQPRVQQLLQQQHQVTYHVGIDSSAHSLCTSLPADPWSEEQWTPGLRELLSPRYCAGMTWVHMGSSALPLPLGGLLSACREVMTPGYGLTGGLHIYNGQVQEEELTGFCTWAGEVGLRFKLLYLTVVLRAGRDEEDWKDVDSAIRRMVEVDVGGEKGQLIGPTYKTAQGNL